MNTQEYFDKIESEANVEYANAQLAREKGFDPESHVDIPLVRTMAQRVEYLIGAVAPQLIGSGLPVRIKELEEKYGALAWEVVFIIAEEVAKEKFCKFKDKREAMEVGIRVGFAYLTLGIVSAPLEGFVELRLKKTKDGKGEYFSIFYSGPVRGAGASPQAVSVIIADYVRKKMGYVPYDPDEREVQRSVTEVDDYHTYVTNLQYKPSDEEVLFLVKHIPVEINGDPTEEREVSNYKDLPRIETNRIRGGMCLVLAEGISQKAQKVYGKISKFSKEFDIGWDFLKDFLEMQKRIKARGKVASDKKILPNYTYISDLVAGRPVLTHPMQKGGFRLRYGRSRTSGDMAACIHPATMILLDKYIATGTQLKVERPGKAAAVTPNDSIDGPIARLKNGNVVRVNSEIEAKQIVHDVDEILFLGDILFNYGDFTESNHILVPAGYCPEWWALELEKAINTGEAGVSSSGFGEERLQQLISNPMHEEVTFKEAAAFSMLFGIPLHPSFTYHWKDISKEELAELLGWLCKANFSLDEIPKIVIPLSKEKRVLELIGLPHIVANNEFVVIERDHALALAESLGIKSSGDAATMLSSIQSEDGDALEIVNRHSKLRIRDKSGIYIGARMGRPEKSKMRKLKGSPHVLFPVGDEGGRLRSFQAAIITGKVKADFAMFYCKVCSKETVFSVCEICGSKTHRMYVCKQCGVLYEPICPKHGKALAYKNSEIDIKSIFGSVLKMFNEKSYPDLIKGVRGTSNKDHVPEHLLKGLLRAKHNVYVNKDGTTRIDMTEIPLTHFRPSEIGTSVERLKELGYEKDAHGKELIDDNQIVEMFVQDLILPAAREGFYEGADDVLFRVGNFVDELLVKLYGLEAIHNFKSKQDVVGCLVIGLAPHISTGILGRVIGFSKTQGILATPQMHSAVRRNCFSHDTTIPLIIGNDIKLVKIGEYVESLNPNKQVDGFGTKEAKAKGTYTFGFDKRSRTIKKVKINNFTKHTKAGPLLKVDMASGNSLTITLNHKFPVFKEGSLVKETASNLHIGDSLLAASKVPFDGRKVDKISIIQLFKDDDYVMVRHCGQLLKPKITQGVRKALAKEQGLSSKLITNYQLRDSYPLKVARKLLHKIDVHPLPAQARISAKRDTAELKPTIPLSEDVLEVFGLYIAEGFARKSTSTKGFYQISIAAIDPEIRSKIKKVFATTFNLQPSEEHKDHLTYSSRILYSLFVEKLRLGNNAKNKDFSFFLNLANKQLACVLRGYFEGDGSVSKTDLRVVCDSCNDQLITQLSFALQRFGIFTRKRLSIRKACGVVRDFYVGKGKALPSFKSTRLVIPPNYVSLYYSNIGFITKRKKGILSYIIKTRTLNGMRLDVLNNDAVIDKIVSITSLPEAETYCLNVEGNIVLANNIVTHQCDGDEACVMLLSDGLINFSRQFLPDSRGGRTMDSPLVLTTRLITAEVDSECQAVDVVWRYPLELYEAALEYKHPSEVKIETLKQRLNTPKEYGDMGYTHEVTSINMGVNCSAYKTIPSMEEKLKGQMEISRKIRAVDQSDVARLVIEKHFIRDIKGNLRKFSQQKFRCVKCNEKYRRPPLLGRCKKCQGKIIFTISEGSIIKYLEPSISLAEKFQVSAYLKQSIELTKRQIIGVFGKDKEKQEGLGRWFG